MRSLPVTTSKAEWKRVAASYVAEARECSQRKEAGFIPHKGVNTGTSACSLVSKTSMVAEPPAVSPATIRAYRDLEVTKLTLRQ